MKCTLTDFGGSIMIWYFITIKLIVIEIAEEVQENKHRKREKLLIMDLKGKRTIWDMF